MENTTDLAVLTFSTSLGGTRAMRITNPHQNATGQILRNAAGRIIAGDPFDATIGSLEELVQAERVITTRTQLI